MSHISAQTRFLEDCFADFESFLEAGEYSDARAVIANLEQKKYYGVAQMFSRKLAEAEQDVVFVPHVDPVPPVLEKGWQEESSRQPEANEDLEQRHLSNLSAQINRGHDNG